LIKVTETKENQNIQNKQLTLIKLFSQKKQVYVLLLKKRNITF
jgi:hypothetical protein